MSSSPAVPLIVGEIIVDFTVTPQGEENKMRLGGITHAARGFWALGKPFTAAAILPKYLEKAAHNYFSKLGCIEFNVLGYVEGAPNVTLIFDPTEVSDQEYDSILREEKSISVLNVDQKIFQKHSEALIFPGSYELSLISSLMPDHMTFHIDPAYDVKSIKELELLGGRIKTVLISTSSDLFRSTGSSGIYELAKNFSNLNLEAIVLKENRGGSRLYSYPDGKVTEIPAQLGSTINSVGVGDVFDAVYLVYRDQGLVEAAWRAAMASAAYAQTTEPDRFFDYVRRDLKFTLSELQDLGGISLPWEVRQRCQIYLAAPDFERAPRYQIDRALAALNYHNFKVRRPVKENGEVPLGSDLNTLRPIYRKDVELLEECQLVFAIPTSRDPGTLVEIGLGIAKGIPVVVYDPLKECDNTMVIAGSACYSHDLDTCLNSTFTILSKVASK